MDPEARGRARASLLPVSVAASALTEFGRTHGYELIQELLLLCRHLTAAPRIASFAQMPPRPCSRH